MMELGATLCTPARTAVQATCPVARWCRRTCPLGSRWRLPAPRRKPKPVRLTLSAAVLLDPRGRTLLVRQKSRHSGLFSNLWQFPVPFESVRPAPRKVGALSAISLWHVRKAGARTLADGAAHRHLPQGPAGAISGARRQIAGGQLADDGRARATPGLTEIERLPISSATRKIAAAARTA